MKFKKKITNYLINFIAKKINKKRTTYGLVFSAIEKPENIGIVIEDATKEQIQVLKNYINRWVGSNNKIKFDIISLNNNLPIDIGLGINTFTIDDINFIGNSKDKVLQTFLEKKFDLLFYLSFDISPISKLVLATIKAKYRVGYAIKNKFNFLDLMVNFDKTKDELLNFKNLIEMTFKYTFLGNDKNDNKK